MNIKEVLNKCNNEDIITSYLLLFDVIPYPDSLNISTKDKLIITNKFKIKADKFISDLKKLEPAKTVNEMTIFFTELKEASKERICEKYSYSFALENNEVKEKVEKDFTLWNDTKEVRIEHYAYDMSPLSELLSYNIASVSIDELGGPICIAMILDEVFHYGYDIEQTDTRREEFKKTITAALDEAISDLDKSKSISLEDFMADMEKEILDSCNDDDERNYIIEQRKFKKNVNDIESRYSYKVNTENHNHLIKLIKEEHKRGNI